MNVKVPNCFCEWRSSTDQFSPSVAAWGRCVLASWYDLPLSLPLGSGLFPAQSYGYSTDYGATFKDSGVALRTRGLGDVFGDPAVTVNSKTGDFLHHRLPPRHGQSPTGLMGLKGHFVADSFVIDINRGDRAWRLQRDPTRRPWIVADSVSGRVRRMASDRQHHERDRDRDPEPYDASLNPIGSETVLASEPTSGASVRRTRTTWSGLTASCTSRGRYRDPFVGPLGTHELVRCDDFGATYGPMHVVSTLSANTKTDAPEPTRLYGLSDVSMAVDIGMGPHRGRAYMVWDESVHFRDAPFGSYTSVVEVENNGAFATATPFVVGGNAARHGGHRRRRFLPLHRHPRPGAGDEGGHGHVGWRFIPRHLPRPRATRRAWRRITPWATPTAWGPFVEASLRRHLLRGDRRRRFTPGSYTYLTALYTPTAADYARDQRDQVVSYSDDGVSWSAPVRMNDSPPGYDGCFPSVTVDDRGRVHAFWMDYRSDPGCGDPLLAHTWHRPATAASRGARTVA